MKDNNTTILLILVTFTIASLTLREFVQAIALTVVIVAVVYGQAQGWWYRLAVWAWNGWRRVWGWLNRTTETAAPRQLYEIVLGYDPGTGRNETEQLPDLGHIGVYGTTRFGKTTFLHSLIHDLISQHRPADLRLLIIDPKEVDYSFYSRLPHLLRPIARNREETAVLIQFLSDEMKYRAGLFAPYAQKSICNNLDRYTELSGQALPRILVIFDELADVIQPGSQMETDLVRLAKLSLAYGIQFIFATQRPSSKVVTGEIKSQVASKFVTWMPTAREYGVVAEIPKEIYETMPRSRGRFMVYTAQGWRMMQAYKIPDRELERTARHYASRPRVWPEPQKETAVTKTVWIGDDEEKAQMLIEYERELGERPSISQVMARFDISKPTAVKYRKLARR